MYQNYSYDEWVEWIARLPEKVPKALHKNYGSAFAKAPNMASRVVYFV